MLRCISYRLLAVVPLSLLLWSDGARAQSPAPDLTAVQRAALTHDARAAQPALLREASRLRLAAVDDSALPQFAISPQGSYQSAVAELPIALPSAGEGVEPPPNLQARLQAEATFGLYDGGRRDALRAVERARLSEQVARLHASRYPLVQAATDTYFAALLAQRSAEAIALSARDLAARRQLTADRVAAGAALASDLARLDAQAIALRQSRDQAEGQRRGAVAFLRELTGLDFASDAALPAPGIDPGVATSTQLDRPELRTFAAGRERIAAQAAQELLATKPNVQAFAQGGIGNPNPLNFFETGFSPFGLVGVRATWTPFDYGAAGKRAAAARIEAEVLQTEEDSFRQNVEAQAARLRVDIARLEATGSEDERRVVLLDDVLATVETQYDEGVTLADSYTDALTDLAAARLTAIQHATELQRQRASLLLTLGGFDLNPATR